MNADHKIDAARIDLALGELRLPGVRLVWASLAATADKEGRPAARFLAALTEQEMVERGRRRFERHLEEARLPPDARQSTRRSRRRPDCRGATNKSHSVKIPLAILSRRDNHQRAATANMALPCAAKFSSRLPRHSDSTFAYQQCERGVAPRTMVVFDAVRPQRLSRLRMHRLHKQRLPTRLPGLRCLRRKMNARALSK